MRRVWRAALAWVLVPLAVLALAEWVLRVAGYGYPVTLFVKKRAHGTPVYVANPQVTRRYFPRAVARAPLPEFFAARKAPGTLRVFVFGESAVVGECYQDVSFTRMLQVMLQRVMPGRTVEVINAGITAINSWVIMPFVRECVQYEPDVFVFYVGNNEVIGPYGPGVAGLAAGSRTIIAARQWLSSLKLYQLAQTLGEAVGTRRSTPRWRGMALFAERTWHPADQRVRRTWRQLVANLTQMRATAQQHGVPVVMCTVAANIQDCPPFASLHDPAAPRARRDACAQETHKGWELFERGMYMAARDAFLNARKADEWYAEARYGYARTCHALHDTNAAVAAYWEAGEADALQFRVPAYANQDLRAACGNTCADVEHACAAASPMNIPGASLLYDHVHFNLQGNYIAATTIVGAVAQCLHVPAKAVPPLDEVTRALGFTAADERDALRKQREFLRQPVFARQRGHAARMQAIDAALAAAHAAVTSQGFAPMAAAYHAALSNRPADHRVWMRLGNCYAECGELSSATAALHRALCANPWDLQGYYDLAHVLTRMSASNETIALLLQAEEVQPGAAATAAALGAAYRAAGDYAAALRWLAHADTLKPGSPDTLCERGNALLDAGDPRAAITAYTEALTAYPDYVPALNNRGTAYAQLGMLDAAASNFTAALALDPQHAEAWNNRGKTFAAQQDYGQALADFTRATALRPHYAEAWSNLGAARAMQGDDAGAIAACTRALAADARYADAYFNRATARAARGDLRGALTDLDACLSLRPGDAAARAARDELAAASSSPRVLATKLTVLTYNVLASISNEPDRTAALLGIIRNAHADIIALQEVTPWMQTAWYAVPWLTSTYYVTSAEVDARACGGQMIASRTPLTAVTAMPLPGPPGRFLLSAHTVVAGVLMRVAAVHLACNLEEGPVRAQQLDAVFKAVRDDPEVVVLGDFNFGDGEAEEQHIAAGYTDVWRAVYPQRPGYTWDIERNAKARMNSFPGEPSRRLDRILIRSSCWQPCTVCLAGDQQLRSDDPMAMPSDHFGLFATFSLTPH